MLFVIFLALAVDNLPLALVNPYPQGDRVLVEFQVAPGRISALKVI